MCLIDDHQIKVANPKALHALAIFRIDEFHHRGIGREEHPALAAFIGDEIDR